MHVIMKLQKLRFDCVSYNMSIMSRRLGSEASLVNRLIMRNTDLSLLPCQCDCDGSRSHFRSVQTLALGTKTRLIHSLNHSGLVAPSVYLHQQRPDRVSPLHEIQLERESLLGTRGL